MSVPKQERRRRRLHDEGEDVSAENPTVAAKPSECESEDESSNIELSGHESAVDDSADQEDETEEGSETETEEGSETEEESGSETEGYTDEEVQGEERQSGDGEEQPENDKPDDDEDKKNPAYVPRKGAFYEHDFRHGGEGLEVEVVEDAKPKKKLWQDEGKWSHDRYNDDMQAPKSRQELIDAYGYDIRSSDRPPEAPPKLPRSEKGPRKQHFKDFMPRMAVIDTTDGGLDTVPNLDDDELIQFNKFTSRNNRRSNMQNSEPRRGRRGGGGRGNYRGNEIETKNDRNRPGSNRANLDGHENVEVPAEDIRSADDFPSLRESSKQSIPKDVQELKREDNIDRMWTDTKPNSNWIQKSYQPENHDNNHRNDFRGDNRDRFQQTQDIRRQEETRGKNRSQQGFQEDRKDVFNHGRNRSGNFINQAQAENWRSVPNDYRDDYSANGRGSHDYGYNRRNQQQQQVTGGNRGPKTGNSGDAGGYFGDNRRGGRGFEQPPYKQQPDLAVAATKEAREYTNSSYRYTDPKYKQKNVQNSSTAPTVGINAVDDSITSNIKSIDISNKENVQTINVTITSTTTEKKSYAKERRAKGVSRPMEGAVMMGSADSPTPPIAPISGSHYQSMPPAGVHMDLTSPALAAANHYSSNRQGMFTESSLVAGGGTKLYNPSLPPPSFFQRDRGGLPPSQHPTHTPGSVQDPAHFSPNLLPPTSALPFGLPVSSTGLALPPNAASIPTNPALFQPQAGPLPAGSISAPATAMISAPFLPAGMMYGAGPRVPPPGAPTAFPLTLAYTSPPPQATVAAAVVGSQPPLQGAAQHKKVYRGDITYYPPELQQPSRTPQKRPKAAIPIIDPQEVPGQPMKEKSLQIGTSEKYSMSKHVGTPINSVSAQATKPVLDQKTLSGAEQHRLRAQYSSSAVLLQSTVGTSVAPSAPLQTAQVSSSLVITEGATAQANNTSVVNHTGNVKSTPSYEVSESKRMAIKTELSPGGPPVNNSVSTVTHLSKDTDQSLSTAMHNLRVENGASKLAMDTSSAGNLDLKQEVCEQPLASSSGSSVV